ncbi:MAG: DUF3108 domain-containing protein [Terriglobia bacterium]|jgi:hypothetical protein
MPTRISRLAAVSLLAFLTVSLTGTAENVPEPFTPGEMLTYDVTWSVFRAGELTATLRRTGEGSNDAYEVTTTARSQGFVSLLFNVNNEFRSFFSPQTLCSQRIMKKTNEGRRHKDTLIVFDRIRNLALLDERDLSQANAPAKHAENVIPACVEDVVTAFYYLRRQHLEVGRTIELPVNDGSKTQRVVVEVQAREKVQTPMGTFDAFRVEPKVINGLLKRKGRMLIWFSADNQQLPLRIKAMISLGSITGTLRSVSHAPPDVSPASP